MKTLRNSIHARVPSLCIATMLAASGLAADTARAQASASYSVSHGFSITTKGNAPPIVKHVYAVDTYARTKTCVDNPKPDKGEAIIGTGTHTVTQTATAPSSTATATAKATITSLTPGAFAGSVEASGSALASLAGCGPKQVGSGNADAKSSSKIRYRGTKLDKKGNIKWAGGWKNGDSVSGKASAKIAKDPIIARLYDKTDGTVDEWTLLTIKSAVSGGATAWDGVILSNDAMNMMFSATVGAPVITQTGELRIRVVDGIVTESVETGMFLGTGLPPVGSPGGFAVPLPAISLDFDLGGDDTHDLEAEFDLDGAGQDDDAVAAVEPQFAASLITDLATGFNTSSISMPTVGDSVLGLNTAVGQFHLAEEFHIPPGATKKLDLVEWPFYQDNAPIGSPIQAAFVRIWHGNPMFGGVPIAGDLFTNRLMDVSFFDVFRVTPDDPTSPLREVKHARIDLSWAPPLFGPGSQPFYIEIVAMGLQGLPGPFTPPSPYPDPERDNALQFNVKSQQWQPAFDWASGRPLAVPFRLYFAEEEPVTRCYADCDGDASLTIDDFICYQTLFALGDPAADCDGDGVLSISDFICYQTMFAVGC